MLRFFIKRIPPCARKLSPRRMGSRPWTLLPHLDESAAPLRTARHRRQGRITGSTRQKQRRLEEEGLEYWTPGGGMSFLPRFQPTGSAVFGCRRETPSTLVTLCFGCRCSGRKNFLTSSQSTLQPVHAGWYVILWGILGLPGDTEQPGTRRDCPSTLSLYADTTPLD